MVTTRKMKLDTFGLDPTKLALGATRDISEERACAALGIPVAVVGFGTGLQTTKVGATMSAFIRLAWTGNIVPSQRPIAQTLQMSLLPDFDTSNALIVGFDNSQVAALQEDKNAQMKRLVEQLRAGSATVYDVRVAEGLTADESHKVFLRPINLVEVPE